MSATDPVSAAGPPRTPARAGRSQGPKGAIVLSTIGYPGATHAVGGAPPLEVVLGNAEVVTVTWRGAPFDVVPHTKQNVAKFSIR